ncbi:MAG: 1-deoxy-D-xylulose-5-phosphate reductoisomerase [Clostridia bacterium]|nr:1-deoxy-D-xylulose-5-phosphate reductoisomerase [Clostridia bacterium]
MKTITILGSTGAVGTQVLNVISKHPDRFKVVGLSAYTNENLLREQITKYNPTHYYFPGGAVEVQSSLFDLIEDEKNTKCLGSLEELAEIPADIVVSAVSGIAGLWSAVAVLKRGGTLAIANKETIVAAGKHLKALEKKYGGKIIPLDTEHSALSTCLDGENSKYVKKLILTASGGALRDVPKGQFSRITPEQALAHPVWKMGKKITIDSATLFNKGLEIVEAMRLFEVPQDKIDVVIHRESIVHSMVEFCDNSIKALLSTPNIALSIERALYYPEKNNASVAPLKLTQLGSLTFEEPDYDKFPCLSIAKEMAKRGDGACIAVSAADEVLVEQFLKYKIKLTDIPTKLEKVLAKFEKIGDVQLDDVTRIDTEARKYTYSIGAK